MKRIFVYIPTASIVTGGGEVFPLLQAKYLALKGFEVTLCCLDYKNPTDYYLRFKQEQKNNIDFLEVNIENDSAIVLGEEVNGLPNKIIELADIVAEIPMNGLKESLNVSVAYGVAGFGIWGE